MTNLVNHTPGPWMVNKDYDNSITVYPVNSGIPWVAGVYSSDKRYEEAEANARLIAAAPELLEELKSTMSQLIKYGALRIGSKKHETLVSLIAKAEGR